MPTPPPDDHAARLARHAAAVQAETAAPVVFPRVGLSGRAMRELAEDNASIVRAIDLAIERARYIPPEPEEYDTAAAHHAASLGHEQRLALLDKVRAEYVALVEHCLNACQGRA